MDEEICHQNAQDLEKFPMCDAHPLFSQMLIPWLDAQATLASMKLIMANLPVRGSNPSKGLQWGTLSMLCLVAAIMQAANFQKAHLVQDLDGKPR